LLRRCGGSVEEVVVIHSAWAVLFIPVRVLRLDLVVFAAGDGCEAVRDLFTVYTSFLTFDLTSKPWHGLGVGCDTSVRRRMW